MRVSLIGLDGGTWDVLNNLVDSGIVPNIRRMIEEGVSGELKSLAPPVTGGVWLSLATGLHPGFTGVLDFLKYEGGSLKPVSSKEYRGIALWDMLGTHKRRTIVIDWPTLYPAYPINGIMVSSWLGLSTYPASIANTIESLVGDYDIVVNYHEEIYNNLDKFFIDMKNSLKKKLMVSRELLRRDRWDLLIDVISHTDWMQHRLWHLFDSSHPLAGTIPASKRRRYMQQFYDLWKKIDDYIGELMEISDIVFIVSDHGFGPNDCVFYINRFLLKKGFIKVKENISISKKKITNNIIKVIRTLNINRLIPRALRNSAIGRRVKLASRIRPIDIIDESASLAYDPGYTIVFAGIHVKNGVDSISDDVINDLSSFCSSHGMKLNLWITRELYKGPKSYTLPNIISLFGNGKCVVSKDLDEGPVFVRGPFSPRHTGSHRMNGIFIAWGKDIRRNERIGGISVLDVVPTILYIFGLPLSKDMSGRPLTEIFVDSSPLKEKQLRYVPSSYYRIRFKVSGAFIEKNR